MVIKIEDMVSESGWLMTTFNFLGEKQFSLPTYIFNEDIEFRVLLDRNFTSELITILNIARKDNGEKLTNEQKIVAAHQAFFQLANITSEPNIAYYEYSDRNDYRSVIEELRLFRTADNLHVQHWTNLALGRKVMLSPSDLEPIQGTPFIKSEVNKKLKNFEANYMIIKKAIALKQKNLPKHEVMLALLQWLHEEFLFTGPSVLFINYYLCPNKPGLKKMIKDFNLSGLRNATWDLTFLQEYVKKIKNEINQINNERWLACTNDNAIKKVLPLLFAHYDEEKEEFQNRLKANFIEAWGKNTGIGKKIYNAHCSYFENSFSEKRKVNQDNFNEHVEKLKRSLDDELGLIC